MMTQQKEIFYKEKVNMSFNDYGRNGRKKAFCNCSLGGSGKPVEIEGVYTTPFDIDHKEVDVVQVTLNDVAMTINNPSNPVAGKRLTLRIKQKVGGTGSGTLIFDTKFRFSSLLPVPVLTTVASAIDYLCFIYNGIDDKFDFIGFVQGF
jgi:hypothetical protein